MEEDIKILEELKNKKYYFSSSWYTTGYFELDKKEKQAIQNLIARYKETKQELETNYIPKSKVQEKINEFKEVSKAIRDKAYGENNIKYDLERIDFVVNMLQDLLED